MANLDMTRCPKSRWKPHYSIEIDGNLISYAYIRKNGCTAFKHFFSGVSDRKRNPDETDIEYLARSHLSDLETVRNSNCQICILRDPVSRTISLYQNKFISNTENLGIFKSYQSITGRTPHRASFAEFVELYLTSPNERIDPHAQSQHFHLMPVFYNATFMLEDLCAGMAGVVGHDLAQRYFSEKQNATGPVTENDRDLSHTSPEKMRERGIMPGRASRCPPYLEATLKNIYQDDYDMLARITA